MDISDVATKYVQIHLLYMSWGEGEKPTQTTEKQPPKKGAPQV